MSKPPYIVGVDVAKIVAMAFVVGVHVAGDGFACGEGATHVGATVVVVFAGCALLDAVRQLIFRTVKRYVL